MTPRYRAALRSVIGAVRPAAICTVAGLAWGGCGSTEATLYVEDAGARISDFYDVEVGANTDAAGGRDSSDDANLDVNDDTPEGNEVGVGDGGDAAGADAVLADGASDSGSETSDLEPACALVPAELDFGTRIAGAEHVDGLRVENCGGFEAENLVIESMIFVNDEVVTSAPEFAFADVTDFPFSLAPNERWDFEIAYDAPTEPAEHTAVVRMQTNDPERTLIDVAIRASAL